MAILHSDFYQDGIVRPLGRLVFVDSRVLVQDLRSNMHLILAIVLGLADQMAVIAFVLRAHVFEHLGIGVEFQMNRDDPRLSSQVRSLKPVVLITKVSLSNARPSSPSKPDSDLLEAAGHPRKPAGK